MAQRDAALCYTVARFVDAEGHALPLRKPARVISGHVFGELIRANVIILSSVMVRRTAFDVAGGFAALPTYGCEDWDLWLRLAHAHPVTVVDDELTLYRRHAANTGWRQVLESAFAVIDRCYADPALARSAPLSRAALRARHCWINAAALAEERRGEAVPLALQALREAPAAVLSRPAFAALAGLLLPHPAVRALRQLFA
jgi:hypothetical protein